VTPFRACRAQLSASSFTCGWIGLAVSSRLIGAIAGNKPERLKRALLVIPGFSVIMVGVNLAIRAAVR
jgi:uncharacterized membrane protein YqgA involved in biofilm formation